ncbi:MAG TPA: response regulator [Thermoanaerobaculia bacterium]|jgi:DNA-binding response OmpR family regulator
MPDASIDDSAAGAKKRPIRMMVRRSLRQIEHLWPFGLKRVLVLEDDTTMQKLVGKLLRPLHVKVDVFGNGRDVIRKIAIEGERYDALLLDLMMPHDGGLTVLRNLEKHHASLLTRVIVMTASGSGITDPWSPFVFAVVQKPFDGSALMTAVRACFQQPESSSIAS